uniref:F-box/LRR-repeat protein 15-like leucin rich repeat domain-containing protein n=1 Tax=Hemiselmis andersenii TaxID=464988 RepID=A0A7S1H030_HEMAN|mmetsp:Transcript_27070/g.65870  ORF Transcript_27070/g.65870 Transcript_27070/m.65870 type:complete len:821 (+) Transcript_27070:635-3097(+)
MAKKTNDPKLLLQSYINLAMYWEEFEEGFKSLEYGELAFDMIVSLRGGLAFVLLSDISPMLRCLELTGKLTKVRDLYADVVKAKVEVYGDKDLRILPFVWGVLDASLRLSNVGAATVEQQAVQRVREGNLEEKMQWYHPPQGERRIVTNIEFVASSVEMGRLLLLRKEYDKAKEELQKVADWREGIRKVGKDWRRKDSTLLDQVRSYEVVADGIFRLGEAYVGLGRLQTGENRMMEGLGHWEELVELEEEAGLRSTCHHLDVESVHIRSLVAAYLSVVNFLIDQNRFTDSVPIVNKALDQMAKSHLRAHSPLFVRTIQRRAQLNLDCHHIEDALKDFDHCQELNAVLYGQDSVQVAACQTDKARFVQYITEPTKDEMSTALHLAAEGLGMMERYFDRSSTRLVPSLRVLGCLLTRQGNLKEGIPYLERYAEITRASPFSEKLSTDRIFALESLAEAYSNQEEFKARKDRAKAKATLRTCMQIVIEDEMRGRKDEAAVERINRKFDKLAKGVRMPLHDRYVHPYLRVCTQCGIIETRPDQFHIWMSTGVIRLCSRDCHDKFVHYQKTNPWLGKDSKAAGGPLSDELVLRFMLNMPERPYWYRLAQTCHRLWMIVSQYRTSIRMPGIYAHQGKSKTGPGDVYKTLDPQLMGRLLKRSPRLLHLDFSDSTNTDDSVCFAIGECLRHLKTLSLRGCPHVSDIGLEEISLCDRLERLDLTHCTHISDEGVCMVSRGLPKLQYLSLSGCREVTETGLEWIAKGGNQLIYLDISYCGRVTDRGVKAIVKHCKGLQYLNVRGVNNISSAELKRIIRLVPHVEGVGSEV